MGYYIGLMSGTSMDGIDVALIDTTANKFLCGLTCGYSKEMKNKLTQLSLKSSQSLAFYAELNRKLGLEFSVAVNQLLQTATLTRKDIMAIGSHGQTIEHNAYAEVPYTVQLGCAHTIAENTGITVVADFRTRDMVNGGQGAPFAPYFHSILFQPQVWPLAIINIGGIANISYLTSQEVLGFDVGPGNCLMDEWIMLHQQKEYDNEGMWAATGEVNNDLLQKLRADSYFQRNAPKSIGKEYFTIAWVMAHITKPIEPKDVQATLLHLTATTIAQSLKKRRNIPATILICGGGAHNISLLRLLSDLLPNLNISSTEKIGINPDFIEAHMFAWLAKKALTRTPIDLTSVTGARCTAVLGAIYPAGIN